MNRESMLEMYLFEATQLLEELEKISIECEKYKKIDTDAINQIFRIMHTIKSSSAMMMFNNVSSLAHSLEDLFYFIRENKNVTIDFESLFDLVLLGIDFIKEEVAKIENGEDSNGSSDLLVQKSSNLLEIMKQAYHEGKSAVPNIVKENKPENKQIKYSARIFYQDGCEMENIRAYTVVYNLQNIASEIHHIPENLAEDFNSVDVIRENGFLVCFSTAEEKETVENLLNETVFLRTLELQTIEDYPKEIKALFGKKEIILNDDEKTVTLSKEEQPSSKCNENQKEEDCTTKSNKQQSIISVNISKLDMLLDLVGEIVISEAMVTKNSDLEGLQLDNFNKASRQLRKLTNELQDIVMSIRMVPVSSTFHKMNRIVRDMSKKLNKEVDLEIIGEDTEVDKNIIDHISDPLMHLVRNAIDHGIEEKEERIACGKQEKGKLTLEAKNAGGDVFIIIKDNGRGLDRKKIYEKAKLQGLTTKNENELSDKDIFSFILVPGFSTNENVTEYSGRGVGMDVVKKNIDSIGGTIFIESIKGKGATISIKIPLTLAIIDGLEVAVGKSKYTIPITSIRESFKVSGEEVIADSDGNEFIMIRGECYPIYRLHRLFNIETDATEPKEGIMIVVEGDSKSGCLFADYLIGEQPVVVKALPSYIKKAKGIAGCTILGDGNISLILDINEVLDR